MNAMTIMNVRTLNAFALCGLLAMISAGCATLNPTHSMEYAGESAEVDEFYEFEPEPPREVLDPLQPLNRAVFHFNDNAYVWVLDPVARGYRNVLPLPVRESFGRAIANISAPVRIANSALQIRFGKAGEELRRFVVNSTWGVAGLTDPAANRMGWEAPSPEDFGQTMGHYGVGPGFPIMLPFLGPSNVRDFIGRYPDYYANPINYALEGNEVVAYNIWSQINFISLNVGAYQNVVKDATDPYILLRDAYDQRRRGLIQEGWEVPEPNLEEMAAVRAEAQADTEQLLVYMQSEDISKRRKRAGVQATLEQAGDLQLLAKLCLGRDAWGRLNPQQRMEYTDLFAPMIGGYVYDRLSLFRIGAIDYGDPVRLNLPGAPKYKVNLFAEANGLRTELILYYANRNGEWKIYDLEALGVSALKSFRGQYTEFLEENSFEDLLADLRDV